MQKFKIHDYQNPLDAKQTICIGGEGLNPAFIHDCLNIAGGSDCVFDISSIGGELKAGIDMFDAIKNYGKADTRIGAMAASSAGIVAMGGRKVTMSKYGLLMLHKPATAAAGNADDLEESLKLLNTMQTRIAQIYMDKSGLDADTVNALINNVTWLTADQALDLGFIDAIEDVAAEVTNHAIVKAYAVNAPLVCQQVFNKLTIEDKNEEMKTEDKELIEKSTGLIAKVLNMFKKSTINTVTDKGNIKSLQPLNVGVPVSNDADEDLEDGEYVYDADGKKVTMKVKDSAIESIDNGADEPDGDEQLVTNLGIVLTNKADAKGIAAVVTNYQAQKITDNALIAELTEQLRVSNAAVDRDKEAIKAEIQSDFVPSGSKRSDTTKVNNQTAMPAFLQATIDGNKQVGAALKITNQAK